MPEEAHETLESVEGEVKWFDPRKGYGFIVGPEGQDIFVHYSVITGDGFRVLRDGAHVRYDAARSDKGWKATAVHRPAEEPATAEPTADAPDDTAAEERTPEVHVIEQQSVLRSPRR